MTERTKIQYGEHVVHDRNGNSVRENDDVVVLRNLSPSDVGSVRADIIPAGCRATAILVDESLGEEVELECYLGPAAFAFARAEGKDLEIFQPREDKFRKDQ